MGIRTRRYVIREKRSDGNWYQPSRLLVRSGDELVEPTFETREQAEIAIDQHYSDWFPGTVQATWFSDLY